MLEMGDGIRADIGSEGYIEDECVGCTIDPLESAARSGADLRHLVNSGRFWRRHVYRAVKCIRIVQYQFSATSRQRDVDSGMISVDFDRSSRCNTDLACRVTCENQCRAG